MPVLCPPLATNREPAAGWRRLAQAWETRPDVVGVTVFHGFSRADIPEARMSVLAVTNNNPALAREIAGELAARLTPETARQAADAGVGATIRVRLGGKSEPVSGTPLDAEALIRTLSDGVFRNRGPMQRGLRIDGGLTAVLDIAGVEVIVCSTRFQPMDPEVCRRNGIDPLEKKILVVKSAQHYRAAYEPLAARIIEADAPGLASQHPSHFPFKNILRPVFPLDKEF